MPSIGVVEPSRAGVIPGDKGVIAEIQVLKPRVSIAGDGDALDRLIAQPIAAQVQLLEVP